MKKRTIKSKIMAVLLAAVTTFSVGTMAMATTAYAANANDEFTIGTSITTDYKISMDKDLMTVTKITSGTLFKALELAGPYGKLLSPALSGLLDAFIGGPADPTQQKLDEINEKIDKLFDKIDAAEASIKTAFSNDLGIQSFYETFIKFKTQTESMSRKIKSILNSDLSNADKLAKIGSLTGNYNEWRANFEDVLEELNELCQKPSLTEDGNIFELSYRHYVNSVMFSGEALDKAKPISDYIMQVYSAGCGTLLESLSAQLYVNCLTDETLATINKDYLAHICKSPDDIYGEIRMVSGHIMGQSAEQGIIGFKDADGKQYPATTPYTSDGKNYFIMPTDNQCFYAEPIYGAVNTAVSFKGLYDKVFNMSRAIFVNKGHENKVLRTTLLVHDHKDDKNADGKWWSNMGDLAANWFNTCVGSNALNADQVKTLAGYVKTKGISIRTLLNQNGYYTGNIPQNAHIVTKSAWNDSTSGASLVCLYNYQKAYYKGINIDSTNPGEENVQILDCGFNGWKGQQWNHMIAGSACVFRNA